MVNSQEQYHDTLRHDTYLLLLSNLTPAHAHPGDKGCGFLSKKIDTKIWIYNQVLVQRKVIIHWKCKQFPKFYQSLCDTWAHFIIYHFMVQWSLTICSWPTRSSKTYIAEYQWIFQNSDDTRRKIVGVVGRFSSTTRRNQRALLTLKKRWWEGYQEKGRIGVFEDAHSTWRKELLQLLCHRHILFLPTERKTQFLVMHVSIRKNPNPKIGYLQTN